MIITVLQAANTIGTVLSPRHEQFRPINRRQDFLDMDHRSTNGLPKRHLARGSGRGILGYPQSASWPDHLASGYATGMFSSRNLERAN